ncbi:MAG: gamma-glutamylcyclotransferase [Rhodospirillaceae bacterium]
MSDIWVFGYGSLVWRPDFPFADARPATVGGWARRFWQGSTDHRGVPEAPGRVVTLVPDAGAVCWGRAYLIAGEGRDEVISHLDYREKGGYSLHDVDIRFPRHSAEAAAGLIYIAGPGNPNWLGDAPLDEIAQQVARSRGPSGHNVEYVVELARALRAIGADDGHVFALADRVAAVAAEERAGGQA